MSVCQYINPIHYSMFLSMTSHLTSCVGGSVCLCAFTLVGHKSCRVTDHNSINTDARFCTNSVPKHNKWSSSSRSKLTPIVYSWEMCANVFILFFSSLFHFVTKFFLVVVSFQSFWKWKPKCLSTRGLFTFRSWCVSSSRWCRLCVFQSLDRVTHIIRTDVASGRLIKCAKIDFVGRDMKQSRSSIRNIYLPTHITVG